MPVTEAEIEAFADFARRQIHNGGAQRSLMELVQTWQALREQEEVHAAIREGLADIAAGRTRPAQEFMDEVRKKLNDSAN